MYETAADLDWLQAVLDRSAERAGPFLRRSFEIPEHSLSARQLAAHLRGSLTVALATVNARGEPRVAPISALLVRGRFHLPTVAESARARHLSRRPGVSLTYFQQTGVAVIVHGTAVLLGEDDPAFGELDRIQVDAGKQSPREWGGSGVYLRVDAETIYTYARHPERVGS